MNVRLFLGSRGACVIVQEMPGLWRRLTGDPFGDDGWFPVQVAVLGKEVYFGSAAVAAAYEYPRCQVLRSGEDLISVLVPEALAAVQRRYCDDELEWLVVRGDARSHRLDWSQMKCWPVTSSDRGLLLVIDEGPQISIRLLVANSQQWVLADEHTTEVVCADPHAFEGALGASCSSGVLMDDAVGRVLFDHSLARLSTLHLQGGQWKLAEVDVADIRARESRYWRSLAETCANYLGTLGDFPIERLVVLESGLRGFLKRFETTAAGIFAEACPVPSEPVPLEAWLPCVRAASTAVTL